MLSLFVTKLMVFMKKENRYVFGCGGHGISVADVALHNFPKSKIVFVDSNAKEGEKIIGFSTIRKKPKSGIIYCGIGDNLKRKNVFKKIKFSSLIASDSYIGYKSSIGEGTIIFHGAHLGPNCKIGCGSIINTNAVLDHEVIIGNFSHISVNCTICGKVSIGENVFIGAGATIKDRIKICNNVTIGCGSIVVKDITISGTYIGAPAKLIK